MKEPSTASMKDALSKVHTRSRYEAAFAGSNYTTRFMRYVTMPESGYFRETDTVFAETYLMQIFRALNDAPAGKNTAGGAPPENWIGGFPAQMFAFIQRDIPYVSELLFPADFAADVKAAFKDMEAALSPVQRRAS